MEVFLGNYCANLFFKKNEVPLLSVADLIAVSMPPGLLVGGSANFIKGEFWDRPTESSCSVILPEAQPKIAQA